MVPTWLIICLTSPSWLYFQVSLAKRAVQFLVKKETKHTCTSCASLRLLWLVLVKLPGIDSSTVFQELTRKGVGRSDCQAALEGVFGQSTRGKIQVNMDAIDDADEVNDSIFGTEGEFNTRHRQ